MTKAIGILGGSFDPVHNGHLRLALEVYQQLGLHKVRLIPIFSPPHRDAPLASPEQRLAMLRLSTEQTPGLVIDDCEIQRKGTSYTIDTVKLLRKNYPDQPLCLIVGMDAFQKLDTWRDWSSLLNYVHIIIVDRPGIKAEFSQAKIAELYTRHLQENNFKFNESIAGVILKLDAPLLDISSSRIRKHAHEGKSIKHLSPDNVIAYIEQENLYQ